MLEEIACDMLHLNEYILVILIEYFRFCALLGMQKGRPTNITVVEKMLRSLVSGVL